MFVTFQEALICAMVVTFHLVLTCKQRFTEQRAMIRLSSMLFSELQMSLTPFNC